GATRVEAAKTVLANKSRAIVVRLSMVGYCSAADEQLSHRWSRRCGDDVRLRAWRRRTNGLSVHEKRRTGNRRRRDPGGAIRISVHGGTEETSRPAKCAARFMAKRRRRAWRSSCARHRREVDGRPDGHDG